MRQASARNGRRRSVPTPSSKSGILSSAAAAARWNHDATLVRLYSDLHHPYGRAPRGFIFFFTPSGCVAPRLITFFSFSFLSLYHTWLSLPSLISPYMRVWLFFSLFPLGYLLRRFHSRFHDLEEGGELGRAWLPSLGSAHNTHSTAVLFSVTREGYAVTKTGTATRVTIPQTAGDEDFCFFSLFFFSYLDTKTSSHEAFREQLRVFYIFFQGFLFFLPFIVVTKSCGKERITLSGTFVVCTENKVLSPPSFFCFLVFSSFLFLLFDIHHTIFSCFFFLLYPAGVWWIDEWMNRRLGGKEEEEEEGGIGHIGKYDF